MVTTDDEYRGYFIPKGTLIIGNTWYVLHADNLSQFSYQGFRNILRDPVIYPDPDTFNPERFLSKAHAASGKSPTPEYRPSDPLSTTFGYGRRMCPGRHLADAQLFLTIACMVQTFDVGCDGSTPVPEFTSGLIR
jgi:hypothetical protein